ncbi:MAG: prepilin-type N-terminal cleavage/methylation domain-containing protein [Candidatus Accumulibacter sp.]|jgi:prepilin-type N-terminal cleavage/methylation domain-containing protein|nr:prepilin-type N-terminal cleavage/methylation domain-containing protein [Accumulibacter sp.]
MKGISRYSYGFTLTELTIVLVIVALLIGGMTLPLSAQLDQRHYDETRRQLNETREALIGFALVNGRLPRPATSLTDGLENPANCGGSDDACTGFVPWSTLGVKKTDAWGKMIRYSVTPAYADASFTLASIANKKIQTRDDAGVASYLVGSASACTASYPCAPAVLLSFGKNNWGTTPEGVAIADDSATNADEDANASATARFFARDPSNAPEYGGEFDDLVVWISPYILFNRMIAVGRLP